MTRLFEACRSSDSPPTAMPEPMAVPSSTMPDADAFEILQKPIVIERHRADDVRVPGEGDDADPVVRPALDELARHFANRIDARGLVAADRKILGQHRLRNVEHQHDVDPARFDLGEALAQLRPRHGDDEEREAQQEERRAGIFPRARRSFSRASAERWSRKR